MKKVLLTTNHPAPYINDWCDIIDEAGCSTNIIYRFRKAGYKRWKDFLGRKGLFYDEINFYTFLREYKKADFAILGGWDNLYCLFVILLSPFYKTKCAVYSDHPSYVINKNLLYYLKKYVILKLVDYIFCATESTCLFYQKNYNIDSAKTVFFPYSYNDSYNKDNETINKKRVEALNNPEEPIRVFIANNFYARKGYDIVVEALGNIANSNDKDKFNFVISGTGELFEKISKQINNLNLNVKILGWVEPAEYVNYMNNCDVFLHASRFEPFGIPPLDALSRGKLLISTTGVESINSLIINDYNGYIYNSENAEELLSILKSIDKSRIYSIGEHGRNTLLEKYNKMVFKNSLIKVL